MIYFNGDLAVINCKSTSYWIFMFNFNSILIHSSEFENYINMSLIKFENISFSFRWNILENINKSDNFKSKF